MRNKKNLLLLILFLISLVVMIFSLVKIILWNIDNMKTNEQINKILDMVDMSEVDNDDDNNKSKFINVDFDKLKKINSDVVGWIRVDGTNIDYPFVQTTDNTYYLNHSFDKAVNNAGWVFLDYRNNVEELDTNTILYAHGRIDGTMFGSLKNTLNSEFFENGSKNLVKISTVNSNYLFEIFSIYHVLTTDDYLYNNFGRSNDYNNFLEMIKKRSLYDFSVNVGSNDKIITLSTCYNSREKVVMHAKLVDEQKRF